MPIPLPALAARDALSDPLGRPRLPVQGGSPSPSPLDVDTVAPADVTEEALGRERGVPGRSGGVESVSSGFGGSPWLHEPSRELCRGQAGGNGWTKLVSMMLGQRRYKKTLTYW